MTKFGPAVLRKNRGNCAIRAWQMRRNALHRAQGVPALVCRRAFARSKENMPVGTLFLLGILRDFSERSRSRSRIFPGASTTSGGFRKCVLSETAGAVFCLMSVACIDGEDRFGADSPATGLNLGSWVRLRLRSTGRI